MTYRQIATQGLRALPLYDDVPSGCVVKPVTTKDFEPHLRAGELAIVDTEDRDPIPGELFYVAWTGSPVQDGVERGALCQAYRRDHMDEHDKPFTAWWVGSMRNRIPQAVSARLVQENRWDDLGWSNGPYREGVLERQIRGCVVGILTERKAS